MEDEPIPNMPRNPIQNPEAYLDWLEALYGEEMRRSAEPFWRRRDLEEEA
jgi:hypothetical protein